MGDSSIKPCVLVILDGFGERSQKEHNAIKLANTPNIEDIRKNFPMSLISTSGKAVGLPEGQMGNSEVGHMNLGAGRIIYQEITRINEAIRTREFHENSVILDTLNTVKENNGAIHFMGLLGDGGVHAHDDHLYALLRLAKEKGLSNRIFVHAFLDGRDTSPKSGKGFLDALQKVCEENDAQVVSLIGRFYAMDRDKRWNRIKKAFQALVDGEGNQTDSLKSALEKSYDSGKTDEFVKPIVRTKEGKVLGRIKDNDAIFFFNFRADRARQLSRVFCQKDFSEFDASNRPKLSHFATMTRYETSLGVPVAFPPSFPENTLGDVISARSLPQFRCAETEKYAHVTYFFNCGGEKALPGEERSLIQSPKEVETYDQKPEMSAPAVTESLLKAIRQKKYPLIVANYANADMVGHTGNEEAAILAVQTIDTSLGKLVKACHETGATLLITADHGNIEKMWDDETDGPHTAHTTNPVPLFLISEIHKKRKLQDGALCDIAPTVLSLMEISKPDEMKGKSLLED